MKRLIVMIAVVAALLVTPAAPGKNKVCTVTTGPGKGKITIVPCPKKG